MRMRDRQYSELIKKLINFEQKGIGFNGEGSCKGGNYIFSITTFFIPLKSTPSSINLTNINYNNCQDLIVFLKSKYGFVTRAQVIEAGQAYCTFDWEIVF
jgi:hypothetical protein